ncbi:MAG: Flp pilus assembly protein CpaB, partial [Brevundimonas sp.]|nr:Flp pilus assembly protein CpaB [Brevundimonas sp.]
MKPARIVVLCIAAVSALGLALVVRAMGQGEPAAPAAAAPVEARPMAKILVAARDLEPGKRLTDGDLSWK